MPSWIPKKHDNYIQNIIEYCETHPDAKDPILDGPDWKTGSFERGEEIVEKHLVEVRREKDYWVPEKGTGVWVPKTKRRKIKIE